MPPLVLGKILYPPFRLFQKMRYSFLLAESKASLQFRNHFRIGSFNQSCDLPRGTLPIFNSGRNYIRNRFILIGSNCHR